MDDTASVFGGGTCNFAIKTDMTLWGWGSNSYGCLGVGDTESHETPIKIMDSVTTFVQMKPGSFVVKSDGTLWGWGGNYYGTLGTGDTQKRLSPVKIMDNVAYISGLNVHVFAIKTDGTLWSWGEGYLGTGSFGPQLTPAKVLDNVSTIDYGPFGWSMHAIQRDGTLWTWGMNSGGELGTGDTYYRFTPVRILDNVALVTPLQGSLSTYPRSYDTLALKSDGTLWGWGNNPYGGLGTGDKSPHYKPVKIM